MIESVYRHLIKRSIEEEFRHRDTLHNQPGG